MTPPERLAALRLALEDARHHAVMVTWAQPVAIAIRELIQDVIFLEALIAAEPPA
jgi:hypothetical protein